MNLDTLKAFSSELEKLAISAGLVNQVLQRRVAQGARVAPKLLQMSGQAATQGLAQAPAAARRAVLGAGEAVRAQQATQRALSNPVTQAMQQRVGNAIRSEAAGAATRTGQPLSKAYEGYMTSSQRAYSPEHMGAVLGTAPVHMPVGQTAYMRSVGTSATLPAGPLPAVPAATVPSNPGATAVSPRRRSNLTPTTSGVQTRTAVGSPQVNPTAATQIAAM